MFILKRVLYEKSKWVFAVLMTVIIAFLAFTEVTPLTVDAATENYGLFLTADGKLRKDSATGADISAEMNSRGAKVSGSSGNLTLTFKNFNFETAVPAILKVPSGTTLNLEGNNVITSLYRGPGAVSAILLESNSTFTINGSGSLTASAGSSTNKSCYCLDAFTATVTIAGNVTANFIGGNGDPGSYGIFTGNGRITITENAIVNVTGGTAVENSYGYLTSSGTLTISQNAVLNVVGGSAGNDSGGIRIANVGKLTISENAVVTATGGPSVKKNSYGISSANENSISFSGESFTVKGGTGAFDKVFSIPSGYKYSLADNTAGTLNLDIGRVTTKASVKLQRKYALLSRPGKGKDILSFKISGQIGTTATSGTTIKVTMPYGTDLKSLKPSITLSEDAVCTPSVSIAQNFTKPVEYTVTSTDTSTKKYTVTVLVAAQDTKAVNITGGTSSKSSAATGETITITANKAPAGRVFDKWVSPDVTLTNISAEQTTFKMPAKAVNITATFKDITYPVNVTGGTSSKSSAATGETITITANKAPAGRVFDKWVSPDVTLSNISAEQTTFKMPAKAVNITATYKTIPAGEYTVTVENDGGGTATANNVSAKAGTAITLSAMPNNGYRFKEWKVTKGGITVKDNKFTMPSAAVTVKAIFEKIPGVNTYTITSGANTTWKKDTTDIVQIICDGNFSKFTGIKLDGVLIDASSYIAVSGSTIITIKLEYLSLINIGTHTLELVYSDGSVQTDLFILGTAAPATTDPIDTTTDPIETTAPAGLDDIVTNSPNNPTVSAGSSDSPSPNSNAFLWAIIGAGAVLLIVAFVIIIILIKKRSPQNNT